MNKIEQLTLLIDQNKDKREELKAKKEELNEERKTAIQMLNKDKSAENRKRLATITQKLNKISQDLLEIRRINKELQRKRGLAYKGKTKLKELEKLKDTGTTLSSHSIVQYLDRGRGMDIDSIRQEVSSSAYTKGNTSSGDVTLDSADMNSTYTAQSLVSSNLQNTNSRLYSSDNFTGQSLDMNISDQDDSSNVSDFEVVNYLRSSGTIDIGEVESEIIDDDIKPIINSDELIGSSGTFTNSEGYRLVVKNGVVVTVLPKDEEDKKVKKKRKKK